jgi:hypothetical protein
VENSDRPRLLLFVALARTPCERVNKLNTDCIRRHFKFRFASSFLAPPWNPTILLSVHSYLV